MTVNDVRWVQRFDNFKKALQTLTEAVELIKQRPLTRLEQQGMIQGFEFTHELAWNVLKDYLEEQGYTNIVGSRNATRLAFKNELITDGDTWMEMIKSRNLTSHTYNIELADSIAADISGRYYTAFCRMEEGFSQLAQDIDL